MTVFNDFLRSVLDGINVVMQNHGWSIIMFTILIRLVLMPLDIKSRKGMRKMQQLQPQINKLSVKYKDDKQKLQQKQSELFRKEHYNPLSGCLPLLIQWPVLIAMFAAMRAIANEQVVAQVFEYLSGIVPQQDGWLWIKSLWMTDSPFTPIAPDYTTLSMVGRDVWQKIYEGLSDETLAQVIANIPNYAAGMIDFSTDEAMKTTVTTLVSAMDSMPAYQEAIAPVSGWQNINLFITSLTLYVKYNGLLILPILSGVSQVLMTKLNPQMADPNAGAAPAQQGQGQSTGMSSFMKYLFPFISVYFCLSSNAGFALYWVTSNVVSTLQSVLITRYFDMKDKKAAEIKAEGEIR